jgi:hypothetical protein
MLPLLAEMHAVDDTINRIIAKVWVEQLNKGVELLGPKRALCEQKSDCI